MHIKLLFTTKLSSQDPPKNSFLGDFLRFWSRLIYKYDPGPYMVWTINNFEEYFWSNMQLCMLQEHTFEKHTAQPR